MDMYDAQSILDVTQVSSIGDFVVVSLKPKQRLDSILVIIEEEIHLRADIERESHVIVPCTKKGRQLLTIQALIKGEIYVFQQRIICSSGTESLYKLLPFCISRAHQQNLDRLMHHIEKMFNSIKIHQYQRNTFFYGTTANFAIFITSDALYSDSNSALQQILAPAESTSQHLHWLYFEVGKERVKVDDYVMMLSGRNKMLSIDTEDEPVLLEALKSSLAKLTTYLERLGYNIAFPKINGSLSAECSRQIYNSITSIDSLISSKPNN